MAALATAAALLLCPGSEASASAPQKSPGFTWQAPAGCPSQAAVLAAIDQYVSSDALADLRVNARVRPDESQGYQVALDVASSRGTTHREFGARTCPAAADAVALIVAIQADPSTRETPPTPPASPVPPAGEPAPVPSPRSAAAPPASGSPRVVDGVRPEPTPDSVGSTAAPRSTTAPAAAPPSAAAPALAAGSVRAGGLGFTVGGLVVGGWGRLPKFDGGGGIATAIDARYLRIELGLTHFIPHAGADTSRPPRREISLWTSSLRICPTLWQNEAVRLPLCGAVEVGRARGVSPEPSNRKRMAATWVGASVGPRVAWTPITGRSGLSLYLGTEAVIPIRMPKFMLADVPPEARNRRVGAQASLGVEVKFSVTERRGPRQGGLR